MMAAAIVAHNHPSGDPDPSHHDLALTRRLRRAGDLVGIPIIDHVVIGAAGYTSIGELVGAEDASWEGEWCRFVHPSPRLKAFLPGHYRGGSIDRDGLWLKE